MRLNRLFHFLILFILGNSAAYAQTGLHIGFFGMPQNTWIMNNQPVKESSTNFKYEATWGYAGMVKLGYNFVDPLGIHVGAVYSVQGQKNTTQDSLGNTVNEQRSVTYLKVPVLLHMSSSPAPVMLNMEIGPQFSFLREASLSENGALVSLPFETESLYLPMDISLTWALGAQFNLTEWLSFILVHRGDYGIFDMEDKAFRINGERYYRSNRQKSINACFGLMGGFNFCLNPQGGGRRTNLYWRN